MQAARKFEDETAKLAAAAKTGDLNAIKAQFGPAANTCKGCHSEFKSN
jgi:cytochrome c556